MRVAQAGTGPRRRSVTESGVDLGWEPWATIEHLVALARDRSRAPLLQRIDPWDDVTLTSSEMPQFLDELDYLRTLAEDDVERDALDELVAMGRLCAEDAGLELLFAGD